MSNGTSQLDQGLGELEQGTGQLNQGMSSLADGTGQLSRGANQLSNGTAQLQAGADQLSANSSKLQSGANQLKDATDQLIDAIDKGEVKLDDFKNNLEDIRKAGVAYSSFGGANSDMKSSVKYIIKTEGITTEE